MIGKAVKRMRPQHRDTVVMGGSAGAIEPLKIILGALDPDLDAAIFVVVHLAPTAPSALPGILARNTRLSVRHPVDGDRIFDRTIYVAPPDRHLVILGDRIGLTRGPRENRSRPSVDVLFRSAASSAGSRVVGVLLSGSPDDGAAGLAVIKARGGMAIVQDPSDASSPGMPEAALTRVQPDLVLPAARIGPAICAAVAGRLEPLPVAVDDPPAQESSMEEHLRVTCPECSGVIEAREHDGVIQFERQVGHRFSEEAMLDARALTARRQHSGSPFGCSKSASAWPTASPSDSAGAATQRRPTASSGRHTTQLCAPRSFAGPSPLMAPRHRRAEG